MVTIDKIRNFAIIAHIDHGKSTLADRLIEKCGNIQKREISNCMLDSMEIEQERGITIKAQTVRLNYKSTSGESYILNLIDTPGHVDFSYEVDRSLAACEGSILVIDSSQGVEAQTLANVYKAIENNHEIILVLNKIDLPGSEPEKVRKQVSDVIGLNTQNTIEISAKNGNGINNVLEEIVNILPAPKGNIQAPLKIMLIDSWYDQYLGVVVLVRVIDGIIRKGMRIKMMSNNAIHTVDRVGIFNPKSVVIDKLCAGDIGFITGNIKEISDCNVGDTIIDIQQPTNKTLPGFKKIRPVIFCGVYPSDSNDYYLLKESIAKLKLNDSSLEYEPDKSKALGFGFRCGFLGILHLEIIQERLEKEYGLNLVITAPSVVYKLRTTSGKIIELYNTEDMPSANQIQYLEEPWVEATIMLPNEYLGTIINLCIDRRGKQKDLKYTNNKVILVYKLPLNEIIFDFYEKLKSSSKGYASCDWEICEYLRSDLIKMSILINTSPVDALSIFIHRSKAISKGREICEYLKSVIPRHLFAIPIQAAIGGKIIARETINALRKDVTAKCYGGDITRKRKLLEKQKKGKKRMRTVGNVTVPKNVFISIFKVDKGR